LRIIGRDDRWPTIAGAIAAAADGDVIEVVGDGPHLSGKIAVVGKRLTLKAAAGCNPVVQPDEAAPTAGGEWLASNRDLTVEGLTINWTVSGAADAANSPGDAAIAVSESAALTMRHCRVFAGGIRTSCLSADGRTLLETCHLACPSSGGGCILWKPTDTLTASGTCFEGRNGIVQVGHESKQERPIQLADCTFRCDSAFMRLRRSATDETPISIVTTRCVYDTNNLVTIYFARGLPKPQQRPSPLELRNGVTSKLTWQDGGCVYRNKMKYFTVSAPKAAQVPTEFDSLSKWHALWNITETTSIEGDLTFDTRPSGAAGKKSTCPRLTAVTNATGPTPAGVLDRP
jgi:hypothetical protein